MIFFKKQKKTDLFDLNQVFFYLNRFFLIFIENVDFCNKKHDFYQEYKKNHGDLNQFQSFFFFVFTFNFCWDLNQIFLEYFFFPENI